MKKYWVAHVRGAIFENLRKEGFRVFYPVMDDYVFLEVKESNEGLLRRQTELAIAFLKKRGKYVTVMESEIDVIKGDVQVGPQVGAKVSVVKGYCANLEGEIVAIDGEWIDLCLQGYNRTYDVRVDRLEVAVK